MERSADATKLTRPVALLLAVFGSGVALETVAVSFTSPTSVVENTTWTVETAPAVTVPRLHVMVVLEVGPIGVPGAQDAPVIELTANGVLLTMASVSTELRASEGPALVTVISQNPLDPAAAGTSGLQTFATCRSADSTTVVETEAVLSLVSGSD